MKPTGLMTPSEAFLGAALLHNNGFNVYISLVHLKKGEGVRYVGDDERRAGRTASLTVYLDHELPIDKIVSLRDRIRELGYDSELDGLNNLDILGKIPNH